MGTERYPYESCPTRLTKMYTGDPNQAYISGREDEKKITTPEMRQRRKEYDAQNRGKKVIRSRRTAGL